MSTQPAQDPAPTGRKWKRRSAFGVVDIVAMIVIMALWKVLMKLNAEGILLPALSRWQFMGVLVAALLALFGLGHLVTRWWSARKAKALPG